MRRILAFLPALILAAFCTACDDGGPPENTNAMANVNAVNANTTNGSGDPNNNSQANVTTTNGNPYGVNQSNANNVNLESPNTSNINNSPPVRKETDKITVDYPNLFLQEDDDAERGKVTFTLERVAGAVSDSTNTNGNKSTTVSKPDHISGAREGTISPVDAEKYDVYVEVKLLTPDLIRTDDAPNPQRLYTGQPEVWEWRLKASPTSSEGEQVSFRFEVNVTWKAKTTGDIIPKNNVWKKQFGVHIGPTAMQVNAALYGSPVFAAGGLVTIGASRRRRKNLSDAEIEEDGPEDQPEPEPEATPTTKAMPKMESKMVGAEEEVEEEVNGTVYAPGQAAQGDQFLVQVYIHLPEQEDALEAIAREADEDAKRRISSQLQKKIKRGTELTFHLQMPGLSVDDDVQSCVWEGEPAWVQFGVTVPEDCKPRNIIGTVTVSEASVPIGHLRFKFKITDVQSGPDAADVPGLEPVPAGNLTRYQQAFISYASKDRQEVLKRVQMLNVAKIKFFQDLLTLEPGDQWEKLLYEYIDKSDVFFLFWSKAASESKWVKREVEYAIKRRANKDEPDPEIIPVIIEGPPPASPPVELSSIHFNDKLIYFINPRESQPVQK